MFWQSSNSCGVILFQVFAVMSMVSLVCSLPAQGSDNVEPPPRHKPYFDTPVKRPRRGISDNDPVRCKEFIETSPDDPHIFTSPNFPNLYPNNTDCVRILDAGENHIIKLEFREMFQMEDNGRAENDCLFDFLEVRDGGYGYSNLLGKFCGNKWPDQLTSSGRRMYLHFHTDDTIEKEGFSLYYTKLPRPTDGDAPVGPELAPCLVSVEGAEGYVNRTDIDHNCPDRVNQSIFFQRPLECMWVINVSLNWKIQLNFLNFKLEMPNDCDNNFVQIFKENTDVPSLLSNFCGAKAEMTVSENNIMHVRFYASPAAINSTFEALFTAYREGNKKPCHADEFDCQDDTCISRSLRCNKRYNCRFRWDEDEDECKKVISPIQEILGSEHIIIILVIFCMILSGMCFAFVFNCVRKLVRDHRIIQEHIRSSREMLEQAGKSTPKESAGHTISRRGSVVGVRGDSVGVASPAGPRSRSAPEDCYVPSSGGMIPLLLRSTPGTDSVTPAPPINGDAVFIRDEHLADRSSSSPRDFDDDVDEDDGNEMDAVEMVAFGGSEPEMRDNECQTRESLFLISSSEHSSSPPLPPPPEPRVRAKGGGSSSHHSGSEARMPPPPPPGWANTPNFTTFGHTRRHPADGPRDRSAALKDYASLPHHHHHHHHQPPPVPAPPPAEAIQRFRAEAVIEVDNSRRPFSVESTKSAPDVIVTH